MAAESKIEWTDATWNPVVGCRRVSEGCRNCYAMTMARRIAAAAEAKLAKDTLYQRSPSEIAYRASVARSDDDRPLPLWNGRAFAVPELLDAPLRWRKPRRVFVNSMSDLFHGDVPFDFIARVWSVMHRAGQHVFQILTKRPGRMAEFFAWRHGQHEGQPQTLPNVWLGVSVESNDHRHRINKLLGCPAAIRFVSAEPLLGPLQLASYLIDGLGPCVDWVIAGGESGPAARPAHPDWFRRLRDDCAEGTPFFFKQWGEWVPWIGQNLTDLPLCNQKRLAAIDHEGAAVTIAEGRKTAGGELMARVGKKAAGRLLDGKLHDGFPMLNQATGYLGG